MRASTLVLGAASVASVLGAPLEKKANYDPLPGGDVDILNYALILEYLEREFYGQGLRNYTEADFCEFAGDDGSRFYKNLQNIYEDEKTHVEFLETALKTAAVPEPSFAFPSTTAQSFLALASILEGVGVSAYLGAAAVIADKAYVPAAGSILTVEARHSAFVREALGAKPFPKPFDTPLNFNQVHSLAIPFITGFAPGTPALPFKAFPKLEVGFVQGHDMVVFEDAYAKAVAAGTLPQGSKVYAVFFSGLDIYYEEVVINGNDYVAPNVPEGCEGQVYVVLSTADGVNAKVADENTVAGVGIVEVGDSKYH